jgi:hypothetical protein
MKPLNENKTRKHHVNIDKDMNYLGYLKIIPFHFIE